MPLFVGQIYPKSHGTELLQPESVCVWTGVIMALLPLHSLNSGMLWGPRSLQNNLNSPGTVSPRLHMDPQNLYSGTCCGHTPGQPLTLLKGLA